MYSITKSLTPTEKEELLKFLSIKGNKSKLAKHLECSRANVSAIINRINSDSVVGSKNYNKIKYLINEPL